MATEYPKDCGANEDMKMTNSTRQITFEVCQTYPRMKLEGNHAIINRSSDKHMYFGENADTGDYYFRGAGKIGIGTTSPGQKLEVNGGVKIGDTSQGSPGSLRFNNGKLQVYQDSQWRFIQVS